MATWLLLDYGQVLCTPPPDDEWSELVAAAGADDAGRFHDLYWEHRPAYDRGDLSPERYWQVVAPHGDLGRLRPLDVAIWLHPDTASVEAAARAAGRGWRLALLSNAPHEVADAIDELDWMQFVGPRLFSCRLGEVKPNPASYERALEQLGAEPADVAFVDDRPANVVAAARLGMRAEVYAGPGHLDSL